MNTDSARSRPPIDITIVTDTCYCGGEYRPIEGELRLRQCMSCGDITIGTDHPLYTKPQRVIAGPELVANVKAMAEHWERLREIAELADLADDPDFTNHPDDPSFAELYENQAQALARDIGRLEIPAEAL